MIVTQQQHAVDTVALSPLHLREYKGPTSKNTLAHIALRVCFFALHKVNSLYLLKGIHPPYHALLLAPIKNQD